MPTGAAIAEPGPETHQEPTQCEPGQGGPGCDLALCPKGRETPVGPIAEHQVEQARDEEHAAEDGQSAVHLACG